MSQRKFVLDDNAFDAICSFVRSANPDCNHSMLAVIEIFSAIVVVMHTARARNPGNLADASVQLASTSGRLAIALRQSPVRLIDRLASSLRKLSGASSGKAARRCDTGKVPMRAARACSS